MMMMVVLVFFERLKSGPFGFMVRMMVVVMVCCRGSSGCDQRRYNFI